MLQKINDKPCLSKIQTYERYKAFKEGQEELQNLPRSGQTSEVSTDENIQKIKKMVVENRHLSVRKMADEVEMSHVFKHNILTEVLGARRVRCTTRSERVEFFAKRASKSNC